MTRLMALVLLMLSCTGCAVGNKYSYNGVTGNLSQKGSGELVAATQDARPYVKSGNKPATFVGLQRGGWGNPFDVNTASGLPLASDINSSLAQTLSAAGYTVATTTVGSGQSTDEAKAKVLEKKPRRAVLLVMNEWKSDTYNNVALKYDVTLYVLDGAGAVLATSKVQGRDDLGGSLMNPPAHARKAIPVALKSKLEQLLGDPTVVKALQASTQSAQK